MSDKRDFLTTVAEKGEIRIAFYSSDDLQRVLELVLGARGEAL